MKKANICWDSSVMIACFRGDKSAKEVRETKSVVDLLDQGVYKLIISTLLYVEMLPYKMPEGTMDLFNDFVKKREIVTNMPVSLGIARKAQEIRDSCPLNLKTPDAIHIATAIVSEAIVFHTFDKGLIRLSEKDEVKGIKITPCHIPGIPIPMF